MSVPTLRPYQVAMLDAIVASLGAGLRRVLCQASTGTGKTVAFAALLQWPGIAAWLRSLPPGPGAKLLIIAHREELLDQSLAKIQRANPGLMASIEQGDRYANSYSDVVIASIQTLAAQKFRRLDRLLGRHTFRIVIIDEAHHAASPTYRNALVRLGFLPPADATAKGGIEAATYDDVAKMEAALRGWDAVAPTDRLLVGVTATPNRTDAIGLACVFQSLVHSYGLKQAIDDGWLVPIKPWVINTSEDLDSVRTSHGDFNQKDLAEAVNCVRRNRLAVDAWKLYASDRSTIAFTVDVQHAHDLAAVFSYNGIQARAMSGETPKDERRDILTRYLSGQIQVVTNCMVLSEGTDLPRTSCILHAKPTKSATLYEQMTGRGLRLFDGKADCLILDVVDIAEKHSLQTAPILYGLPPGLKSEGEDLRQQTAALDELREKYPFFDLDAQLAKGGASVRELLDRAKTFDVWTVPSLGTLAGSVSMNWIRVGADTFRLQYPWSDGIEILSVQPDVLGHYDLSLTLRPAQGGAVRQRTIGAQIPSAQAALQLAEAFLGQERASVSKLKDKEARWRSRPASPKQIAYLQRLRVPFNPTSLTMGEASDKIDLASARRGR